MILEKTIEDGLGPCYKKLATLEEGFSKMMRMLMEEKKEDDMGACIEKLDKVGWAAQDPMHDTALLLFGQSADYRKLWLHLKPESCGNWVKSVGRKPVRDGAERQQWSELCEILEPVILSFSKDRWTCDLNGDGKFRIKEVRSLLDNIFIPSANVPTRWVEFISIKINIFAWRAT
nr:RNA-directed DNA polymerase, eukaryota [Tanacetum cinerariifolium]